MSHLVLTANAGDGTISALLLDDGRLSPLATSAVGKGVGTFAIDAARNRVYAGVKADGDAPPAIVTLRLDRSGGRLTEVSRRAVDDSLAYVSLTEDRRFVLGASYGGGFGGAWPVAGDGTLGEATARIEYPNVHCAVSEGDLAYFVSLGADLVAQYRIGADGALQPLGEVGFPKGCGPRHLILEGPNAYLITEYSGEVFHLTRTDGLLTRRSAVSVVDPAAELKHSRMGAKPREEGLIWTADVHRAGDFLLASERTASTLASVALGPGGTLGDVVAYAATVEQPRGFVVSPCGRYAIVVGERATEAQLLQVADDGALTEVQRVPVGSGANWVRVVDNR